MPVWGSLLFQNAMSPVMEQLIYFHDHTMMIMFLIIVLVGYMLINSIVNGIYNRGIHEGQGLESIWTILPAVFLLMIAFPSLRLLYLMEELESPEMTVKVMGHQWYWVYEYTDTSFKSFESYMSGEEGKSLFRLLSVDNSLVFPVETNIRVVVSSYDVIHSWTLPSVGVKSDAVPGRLNQMSLFLKRVGVVTGQCSEICGANHSFMPIVVSVIPRGEFLFKWI